MVSKSYESRGRSDGISCRDTAARPHLPLSLTWPWGRASRLFGPIVLGPDGAMELVQNFLGDFLILAGRRNRLGLWLDNLRLRRLFLSGGMLRILAGLIIGERILQDRAAAFAVVH